MRFRKRKNKYLWYIVLAIFVLMSVFILQFKLNASKNPKLSISADQINQDDRIAKAIDSNENPKNIPQNKNDDLQIPVLMYHHIRKFNDSGDKIGTNLSVSPEDFGKQLDLIKSKGYTTITFQDLENGNIPAKPLILTFDDGYLNFYEAAFPELKQREMTAVAFIITGSITNKDYMNKEQIIEIDKAGIEIGSHTVSHPDLTKSTSEKAKSQITKSKEVLEEFLNKDVISFCYPSGKYNEETLKLVEEAGFLYAVTTKSGLADLKNSFDLNRYRVDNGTNINRYLK